MKFLLGQTLTIFISVIILYYLFNTTEFLPYLPNGGINWQNITVYVFFASAIILNITSVLYILINKISLKKTIDKKTIHTSFKVGGIFLLGIITVTILNFLHILNIYYGVGVLAIVLLILLVI